MYCRYVFLVLAVLSVLLLPFSVFAGDDVVQSDDLVKQLTKKKPLTRGFVVKKDSASRPSATIYIYFATNSSEIKGDQSFIQLDELGRALTSKALENARMEIGGHTDSVGSDAYNLDLSKRRAQAVSAYLSQTFGINDVAVQGYGETKPVASNNTDDGRAKNRRVVITRVD